MKIEILMLKENNERGVRMMFLSLEQLQKLKLNPTRADYEIAYETEVKEQEGTALNVSEIMEGLYERLNRPDRPNRKTMRSMSVGDIIQIDGKELFFCDSVGFKKISFAGTGELVLKAGKENSEKGHEPKIIRQKRCGHERSGTGDVFASIIAASAVLGYDFELSVRKASHFVRDCIAATEAMDIPPTDGVCFEEILHTLK